VAGLDELRPLTFRRVRSAEERRLWRELVARYHPSGHRVPFGAHLRWLVEGARPLARLVACVPGLEAPVGAPPVETFADGVGQRLAAQAPAVSDDALDELQLGGAEGSILELEALVAVRLSHADATVQRRRENVQRFLITSRLDPR
jgi:hypothetical protein